MLIKKFVFYDWKFWVGLSFLSFSTENIEWSSIEVLVCLFVCNCNWVSPIELWNAPIKWALMFPFSYLSQLIGWRYHLTCQYWTKCTLTIPITMLLELLEVSNNPCTHRATGIPWSNHRYSCQAQCNKPSSLKSSSKLIIQFTWIIMIQAFV